MSTVRTISAGRTQGVPGEKKKRILLVCLAVLLIAILAIQVPRLMNSGSSAEAPSNDTATGVVTEVAPVDATAGATAAPPAAADPAAAAPAAATRTRAEQAAVLAVRRLPARDPFVPLLGTETTTASAAAAEAAAAAAAAAAPKAEAPKPEPAVSAPAKESPVLPTPAPAAKAAVAKPAEAAAAKPAKATAPEAAAKPGASKPAVVGVKVKPTVAVVRANGKQQAVAEGEYFKLGDLWFRLVEVAPKTMKVAVVGGSFTGGRQTLTVELDRPVTLFNTATGVEYTLGIAKATSGIATTSLPEPTAPEAAQPAAEAPASEPADPTTTTAAEPATTS
jgi:hypothetical protein